LIRSKITDRRILILKIEFELKDKCLDTINQYSLFCIKIIYIESYLTFFITIPSQDCQIKLRR